MEEKRILVADKIAEEGVEYLKSQPGFNVNVITGLDEKGLCASISDYHAVIVRSASRITPAVLDQAHSLQVIGRAGIGVDNIDIDYATQRGVAVLNTPDANATTTAELAMAHLLSLSRSLPQADRSVRAGEWKRSLFMGAELANKTLGIVGYGTIGRIVAARAKAFKMNVTVYDPFVTEEVCQSDNVTPLDLDNLFDTADYISLHCPLNDKTRSIINDETISRMKKGVRLINCARGGLVDEQALYAALKAGHMAGAALDVFAEEPPTKSPLLDLDNIVFTPHLGASTQEAQIAAGSEIARQIATYLQTGEPINAINLPPVSAEELIKLKPYLVLVKRLGKILAPMLDAPVKKVDVILCGEATQRNVRSISVEGLIGLLGSNLSVPVNPVNAVKIAEQHGIRLVETLCDAHPDFHATVGLCAYHGDKTTTVEGALFDRKHPRLVRVNDYEIEAVLDGHLLITRHRDQPGVVAGISSILARQQINISRMQLGIVNDSDTAIAIMGVSTPLEAALLNEIAALNAIDKVMQISL